MTFWFAPSAEPQSAAAEAATQFKRAFAGASRRAWLAAVLAITANIAQMAAVLFIALWLVQAARFNTNFWLLAPALLAIIWLLRRCRKVFDGAGFGKRIAITLGLAAVVSLFGPFTPLPLALFAFASVAIGFLRLPNGRQLAAQLDGAGNLPSTAAAALSLCSLESMASDTAPIAAYFRRRTYQQATVAVGQCHLDKLLAAAQVGPRWAAVGLTTAAACACLLLIPPTHRSAGGPAWFNNWFAARVAPIPAARPLLPLHSPRSLNPGARNRVAPHSAMQGKTKPAPTPSPAIASAALAGKLKANIKTEKRLVKQLAALQRRGGRRSTALAEGLKKLRNEISLLRPINFPHSTLAAVQGALHAGRHGHQAPMFHRAAAAIHQLLEKDSDALKHMDLPNGSGGHMPANAGHSTLPNGPHHLPHVASRGSSQAGVHPSPASAGGSAMGFAAAGVRVYQAAMPSPRNTSQRGAASGGATSPVAGRHTAIPPTETPSRSVPAAYEAIIRRYFSVRP